MSPVMAQVGEEDADDVGAAGAQGTGTGIGGIARLAGVLKDAGNGGIGQADGLAAAVKGERDGGDREVEGIRNLFEGRHFLKRG